MAFYCKSSAGSHLHSSIFPFLIIMAILSFLPSSVHSISFNFPDFTHDPQMVHHEGESSIASGVIELTAHTNYSVGRATYRDPIKLWDATTGRLTDFDTRFSFSIQVLANNSDKGYGDGLTFFLAPVGSKLPPNSSGGFLGLLSPDEAFQQSATNKIVAVEFDSFRNEWDPSSDHVGINVNSVASKAIKSLNSIKNGTIANAWVTYNSTTHNLSVYLTYARKPVFSGSPIVCHMVDLGKILPGNITVGFSAATGTAIELHRVLSWEFNSTLGIEEKLVNTTDKRKTNPSNMTDIHKGRASKNLLVGVVVGVGVFGCALGFAFFIWWKKRKISRNLELDDIRTPSTEDEFEKETGPKRFSYRELAHATSNFHVGGILGQGGFGGVYKGFLIDINLNVAVKRISSESKQGKKEYQSEVRIISRLRHRNLVQLIGWCHERNELLLVYEFMPNRSLDKHLFQRENVLSWEIRYKIATGLASALLYLHEEWEQCVVHRDVKSSNVMLDSNFNAKLGDFGLARLVDHDLGSQTTVVAGTFGYLAPECIYTGRSNRESDVYSFGIVALEIACGRKPVEINKKSLVECVWELYGNGKIIEAADERLNMKFDENQIQRMMVMGLWCAHPDPTTRPSIRQVVNILNDHESPLMKLPTKLPALVFYAPAMNMCKLAFASAFGDDTNSQVDGSQCTCSSCSNANLSQTTIPSASYSSS